MRRILGVTRYAVIIPALAAILGALLLMVQGSIAMVTAIIGSVTGRTYLKDTIVEVLTSVTANMKQVRVRESGIGRENHLMMLNHYQQTKNLLVSYAEGPMGFF